MSYNNIPPELQQLKQWVVSRSVEDKIPRNPRTGEVASVVDPTTWGTFHEAIHSGSNQIGFVLTPWDPYTIIDLDNKPEKPCTPEQLELHNRILGAFQSYTEVSTSGSGYHIVVKGSIPAAIHRDNVEVYSHSRYMVFTGRVTNPYPINDYQPLLDNMYSQMYVESTRAELVDQEEVISDTDLVEMAASAENGYKFMELAAGRYEQFNYPSQSEADLAFISMLVFYSVSDEQVRRIFRLSELGQRDKAVKNDKYINFAIGRARATQAAPVGIEAINENVDNLVKNLVGKVVNTVPQIGSADHTAFAQPSGMVATVEEDDTVFPPGLVGEVAEYIYSSAVRPVKKIALAGAITFIAGVVGRSYNFSNTGLNQYIVLLATTGTGKEGAQSGITSLIDCISRKTPAVHQFFGPGSYSSGQALVRVLDERKCYFSIMGEFGITLSRITDPKANAADKTFRKVLLDLYGKSGWNQWLQSSVYADSEKNTQQVRAPALTILGESTPEEFFGRLNSRNIADGLIPRFILMQYKGKRLPRNLNAHNPPNEILVDKLVALVSKALTAEAQNLNCPVGIQPDALKLLDGFDVRADNEINHPDADDACKQLWNRAHLKALKLAALIAVGVNYNNPVITIEHAQFAIDMVAKDIEAMMGNFQSGMLASTEVRREQLIMDACTAYLNMSFDKRLTYIKNTALARLDVVPIGFLRRRLRNNAEFTDTGDTGRALDGALKSLVDMGDLKPVGQPELIKHGLKAKTEVYAVCNKFE